MDSVSLTPLHWNHAEMVYPCQFGEITYLNPKLSELKLVPYFYNLAAQNLPAMLSKNKLIDHTHSMPSCDTVETVNTTKCSLSKHFPAAYKHDFTNSLTSLKECMERCKNKVFNHQKRHIQKRTPFNIYTIFFKTAYSTVCVNGSSFILKNHLAL